MNSMHSGHNSRLVQNLKFAAIVGMMMIWIANTISPSGTNGILMAAKMVSGVGNVLFLIAANGIMFFLAYEKGEEHIFFLTLKVNAVVVALVHTLKHINMGHWVLRPSGHLGGFPSGHTTHAFAMAFLLSMYYPRLAWFWYGCASVIAWSRIETNAHTGLQVTAGVVFGIGIAWFLLNNLFQARREHNLELRA